MGNKGERREGWRDGGVERKGEREREKNDLTRGGKGNEKTGKNCVRAMVLLYGLVVESQMALFALLSCPWLLPPPLIQGFTNRERELAAHTSKRVRKARIE